MRPIGQAFRRGLETRAERVAGAGGESMRPIVQAFRRVLETRAERVVGAGGESKRPFGQALRRGLETRAERVFVAARTMIQHSAGGRPSGSDACAVRRPRERTSVYQPEAQARVFPFCRKDLRHPRLLRRASLVSPPVTVRRSRLASRSQIIRRPFNQTPRTL
jgi:hypothetical protein